MRFTKALLTLPPHIRVLHMDGQTGTTNQQDQICSTDKRVQGTLQGGDVGHIDLWYTGAKAFYRAKCYFWCTEDGGLPKPHSDLDADLVDRLMRGKWKTENVIVDHDEGKQEVVPISPIAHYQLSRKGCKGKCSRSTRFEWRGEGECRGRFVCCTLGGNVCGDYGLHVADIGIATPSSTGRLS